MRRKDMHTGMPLISMTYTMLTEGVSHYILTMSLHSSALNLLVAQHCTWVALWIYSQFQNSTHTCTGKAVVQEMASWSVKGPNNSLHYNLCTSHSGMKTAKGCCMSSLLDLTKGIHLWLSEKETQIPHAWTHLEAVPWKNYLTAKRDFEHAEDLIPHL